jgi:hypothetical protein
MTGAAQPPAGGTARKPVTGRRQRPCSHPPKPRPGAYAHRPGAGPGRTPRRTQGHGTGRRPVRVVLPEEPPTLTTAAARALLRVLLKAYEAQRHEEKGDRR